MTPGIHQYPECASSVFCNTLAGSFFLPLAPDPKRPEVIAIKITLKPSESKVD